MSRAKRALIMAAGFGHRMMPLTLTVPKPLVAVNGVRMIEGQIGVLHENGIEEIIIVTGHLAEQFNYLPEKYPGVKLIHNPDYAAGNNITSLYYAREYLGACLIMDGDIIIRDPKVLDLDYAHSTYCCTWFEDIKTEWIFRHKDWKVTECLQEGGTGWGLRSISFWTEEDGLRLKHQLAEAYEDLGIRDNYWDYVPVVLHRQDYDLGLRPLSEEAILEIDSFEELCREDPSYIEWREKNEEIC